MQSFELPAIRKPASTPLAAAIAANNLEEVQTLLRLSHNAYETNEDDEPLLVLTMNQKLEAITDQLLDQYERDLNVLRTYFEGEGITNGFWLREKVLLSIGVEQTKKIQSMVTKTMQVDAKAMTDPPGLIVLCKTPDKDSVLWLSPLGVGDDRVIAHIIDQIYGNGKIDVLQQPFSDQSLLAVAAKNGMTNTFFRLERLFGHALDWTGIQYFPLLCHLAAMAEPIREDTLQTLIDRLARFNLKDICESEKAWRLLEVPLRLKQLHIFERVLDEIVAARKESHSIVLGEFVRRSNCLDRAAKFYGNAVDLSDLAPFCWLHHVDLVTPRTETSRSTLDVPLLSFTDELVAGLDAYLIENCASIVEQQRLLDELFRTLMLQINGLPVLRAWLESCPAALRNVSERVSYKMFDAPAEMIGFFAEVAPKWFRKEAIRNLVWKCSAAPNGGPPLEALLKLPLSPPVTEISMNQDVRTPLANALANHRVDNYRAMVNTLECPEDLADVRENSGMNLLAAAIWNRQPAATDYELDYGDQRMYILDDGWSDDPFPPNPTETQADLHIHYEQIFDELLSCGCDPHVRDSNGNNLLHIAVLQDNVWAVNKLLSLGIDPMSTNNYESLPVHSVRSKSVFEALMATTRAAVMSNKNMLTKRNTDGYTPLAAVLSVPLVFDQDLALLDAIAARSDSFDEITDAVRTSLALHRVGTDDAPLAQWILRHGADVNALDENGETAWHIAGKWGSRRFNVIKVMLDDERLDLQVISPKGVTFLAILVQLSEKLFADVLPIVEQSRRADFDRLFEEQCNSLDYIGNPILATAIRSDTNAYCLQRLEKCSSLQRQGVAVAALAEPMHRVWAVDEQVASCGVKHLDSYLTMAIGNKFISLGSQLESVRLLLEAGASATRTNSHRVTQLETAFNMGSGRKNVIHIAAALIAAGADYQLEAVAVAMRYTVLNCLLVAETASNKKI